MRKIAVLVCFLLILPVFVCAQNFSGRRQNKIPIAEPEKSLKIGERLEYSLEWLGVPVGTITLHVEEIRNIEGHDCYYVTAHAMPNKYLAKLYDVEYTVHTYIDTKHIYTRRFEKIRRMKDQYNYVTIDFDRENKRVEYRSEGSAPLFDISEGHRDEAGQEIPRTLEGINGTQDLFSSIYYLRLLELKKNHSYNIEIYYDQKNWPLTMRVGEPFMMDIRHQGTFAVFKTTMDSELGKFILGKSKMTVYFTADSRRIPVEFKFWTGLGYIRGIISDRSD